jgi:hypothetical protein
MNYSAKLLHKTMIGMKRAVIDLAIAVFLEFLFRVTSMHPTSIRQHQRANARPNQSNYQCRQNKRHYVVYPARKAYYVKQRR